jgi:uncharacterized protein (TIGR02266 family)
MRADRAARMRAVPPGSTEATLNAEARRSPRLRRRVVYVEVQVGGDREVFLRKARNLSTGGMFVDAPVPLPVGTTVELQFRLPSGPEFAFLGEVRWTSEQTALAGGKPRNPGMGIVFVELRSGDAAELQAFVDDDL